MNYNFANHKAAYTDLDWENLSVIVLSTELQCLLHLNHAFGYLSVNIRFCVITREVPAGSAGQVALPVTLPLLSIRHKSHRIMHAPEIYINLALNLIWLILFILGIKVF